MANCLDCLHMKIKHVEAKCTKGHFFTDSGEKVFKCKKQLDRYGKVVGFALWENKKCKDFEDLCDNRHFS